ncbi:putative bifunctional diguanylate cyclase/phosphodiesterase [Inhella gelatinilytica]|uniref:EAL domain-containing protein n=1 Tax=Inhella gelatinilytica TaxID=2795030 RepID=A0A931IZE4_9BURK|nr:GGDEF domain-containing phosphodiesterase [Inhella gelatinilytica]MBH9553919.1 EAL domain-containing protein [Inhella gelatinilytica]
MAKDPPLIIGEETWKLALEASGDGVWDWHIQEGVEHFSPGFLSIYGYTLEDLAADPDAIDALTHPDDREQMARDRQAHFEGRTAVYRNEHRVRCKDGSLKWVLTRGMVIARSADGRPLRMVGTHTDITSRKLVEAQTWRQAHHDALTDLPNRRLLTERLSTEIKHARRDGHQLALMALDLDRFKAVNDQWGHDAGDELLRQAAQRIAACIREVDMVARLGGDEFIVLLTDVQGEPSCIERVASALVARLDEVFTLGGHKASVSASIGIALFPTDAHDARGLFKRADQALYAVKRAGRRGYRFAGDALQDAAQARSRLGQELRQALDREEFRVHVQPVLPIDAGPCLHAEVLLRWQHPVLGLLGPGSFLALAESSGLIRDIGSWVLRDSARWLRQWRETLHPDLSLSLNISGVQLREWSGKVTDWTAHLHQLGVPGSGVVLDLRESLLRDTHLRGLLQLPALRAAGVGVALDDFGNADSRLDSLRHPGLSQVKLARELIVGLKPHSREAAWLSALVQLARSQGLRTIAKGVESAAQVQVLSRLGVDALQGQHLAAAVPAADFSDWWQAHRPAP